MASPALPVDTRHAYIRLLISEDNDALVELAWRVWLETYPPIVGMGQTVYMLNRAYTAQALDDARLYRSESFWGLYLPAGEGRDTEMLAGFVSTRIASDGGRTWLVLPKVYIDGRYQGAGLGRQLIEHAAGVASALGLGQMRLNVNRGNPAVNFYQRVGFRPLFKVDLPYGPYWLNDYIMGYDVRPISSGTVA